MTEDPTRNGPGDEPDQPAMIDTDAVDATAAVVSSDYKVRGKKSAPDGAGVLGHNTATTGTARGVEGVTDSPSRAAAGVHGQATAGSGATYGVDGVTQSSDTGAAGVRGSTSGANRGVVGDAYDTRSNLPTLSSSRAAAIFGRSDKSAGTGVVGWSKNSDGVHGRSDDSDSSAVFAENTSGGWALETNTESKIGGDLNVDNDVFVTNNLDVSGHADIRTVGAEVYLANNFTISDSNREVVVWDTVEDDDFGAYDKSTGIYELPENGDYHVDFMVDWSDSFSAGDTIQYDLRINGGNNGGLSADTTVPSNMAPARCFSKTLYDMVGGVELTVEVDQVSGSSKDIWGSSSQETYWTITKVG